MRLCKGVNRDPLQITNGYKWSGVNGSRALLAGVAAGVFSFVGGHIAKGLNLSKHGLKIFEEIGENAVGEIFGGGVSFFCGDLGIPPGSDFSAYCGVSFGVDSEPKQQEVPSF